MHFFALSSDCAAFDWLFRLMYLTWWPRMPPWASMYLKYASAPQLSDSPIWAYTPESASSPQATMVELALAPPPPPPPLHAASAPAARTVAVAAANLNVTRLRIIVLPFCNVLLTRGLIVRCPFSCRRAVS